LNIRKIAIVLLAGSLPLVGCEQRESNKQQMEAQRQFEQAYTHLERATSGTRHEKRGEDSPSIGEYRRAQLQEAAEQIKGLTNQGPAAQKAAAMALIAESHTAKARMHARTAGDLWTHQTPLASELSSHASSIRSAQTVASEHAKVDHEQYLGDLNAQQAELVAEIDRLKTDITDVRSTVEDLREQVQTATDKRNELVAEAEQLSRKAFAAEGQAQYDLYVKAASATRAADRQTAAADMAAAKLSVEHARLRVLEMNLKHAEQLLAEVRDAIEKAQQRRTDVKQITSESNQRIETLTTQFNEKFTQYVARQTEQIDQAFADAAEQYQAAIDQYTAAKNVAPSETRQAFELELAAMQGQLGQVHAQHETINKAYVNTLKSLSENARDALPRINESIQQAHDAASQRLGQHTDAAREALRAAAATLEEIATDGDDEAKQIAQQLKAEYDKSLAALGG